MDFDEKNRQRPPTFTEIQTAWELLAAAVIRKAIEDWFRGTQRRKQEVERFLLSTYFEEISDIDPKWLIKTMKGGADVEKFKNILNKKETSIIWKQRKEHSTWMN